MHMDHYPAIPISHPVERHTPHHLGPPALPLQETGACDAWRSTCILHLSPPRTEVGLSISSLDREAALGDDQKSTVFA
jgi:hypothetical protein